MPINPMNTKGNKTTGRVFIIDSDFRNPITLSSYFLDEEFARINDVPEIRAENAKAKNVFFIPKRNLVNKVKKIRFSVRKMTDNLIASLLLSNSVTLNLEAESNITITKAKRPMDAVKTCGKLMLSMPVVLRQLSKMPKASKKSMFGIFILLENIFRIVPIIKIKDKYAK